MSRAEATTKAGGGGPAGGGAGNRDGGEAGASVRTEAGAKTEAGARSEAGASGRTEAGVSVRTALDRSMGCPHLAVRHVRVEPGASWSGAAEGAGEAWYVTGGSGRLEAGGRVLAVVPESGLWLSGGMAYHLVGEGSSGTAMVAVVAQDDVPADAGGGRADEVVVSLLADAEPERTGERTFRVVLEPAVGCPALTQFVGEIPPGRAPPHEHTYDEVVTVLDGEGVVHLAGRDAPLRPGACVYLSPGTSHCLENTGSAPLRVLGVFHPPGSPACKT